MTRREAERQADITGRPVQWNGTTVYPDYRPGHTHHPQLAAIHYHTTGASK